MTQSSETLLQGFIHSFIHSFTAVPNLFGTRDRFPGRQFFHGWGRGSGMVQAVIRARRSGCKYRRSFARSSDAHPLLFGPVPNRLRTDSCPRPGGWGLLIYFQNVTAKQCSLGRASFGLPQKPLCIGCLYVCLFFFFFPLTRVLLYLKHRVFGKV